MACDVSGFIGDFMVVEKCYGDLMGQPNHHFLE
jgi:hypothetical protein